MTVTTATLGERALRRLGVAVVPVADRPALSTTVPAATIATNALVELGVISAEETGSASDQALVLAKVNAVHDSMVGQANVRWTINTIPQAVSEEYTKLTALNSASSFGKQADPQLIKLLEGRVRQITVVMQAPDEATDAVQQVHNDLAMRGLARWTVFDIPPGVEDSYTMLAANRLAPTFGMEFNPRDDQAAMTAIYRYIALPSSGETVRTAYF